MRIVAGDVVIECTEIKIDSVTDSGIPIQAAKIILPTNISQEQIDALLKNSWTIYDNAEKMIGAKSGFNLVKDICVTVMRVADDADYVQRLKTITEEMAAKKLLAEQIAAEAEAYVYACEQADARLMETKLTEVKAIAR